MMATSDLMPLPEKKPRRESRPPAHFYPDHDGNVTSPRSTVALNHDLCDACGDGGSLLCCDSCPCSFHLMCVDPPLKDVPLGDWFCNQCLARDPKHVEAIPAPVKDNKFFSALMQRLRATNPHAFQLSSELVAAVTRDDEGGRSSGVPSASENESESRPEGPTIKPHKPRGRGRPARDNNLCRICQQGDAPLLRCVRCVRAYHLYCLDPPLVSMPSRAWFCPEHPGYMKQRSHVLGERVASLSFEPIGERQDRRKPVPHRSPKRTLPVATEEPRVTSPPPSPTKRAPARRPAPATVDQNGEDEAGDSDEEQKSLTSQTKDAEFVLSLQHLQQQLEAGPRIETYPDGESFLARARAKAKQQALEEQAVEAARLKALEDALLPAAFPNWVATAENDAITVPPALVTHLSPLFVQFLAWQRLCEVSQQLASMPNSALPSSAIASAPPAAPPGAVPRKQPRAPSPPPPPAPSPAPVSSSAPSPVSSAAPQAKRHKPAPSLGPSSASLDSTSPVGPSPPTPSTPLSSPPPTPRESATSPPPAPAPSPKPKAAVVVTEQPFRAPAPVSKPPPKPAAKPATKQAQIGPLYHTGPFTPTPFPNPYTGELGFRISLHDGLHVWIFTPPTVKYPVECGRRRNETPTADAPRVDINLNDIPGNSLVSRRQGNVTWNANKRCHIFTNYGRNGTTVGVEKLTGQMNTQLRDGQVLKFGKISLQYHIQRLDGTFPTFLPFRNDAI